MNGATVLTRFTADTKDFDSKTKNVNVSISSIAKGVVAATGVTKALSAAFDLLRNSIDGAISRYDIMNNFPRVMNNLGIAAEDAQKSLDLMSEKLMGLPTTLDEGALAVQRFTSANNDVKKSTDIFLAVNNAILAGGAGAAIQSSALEQLSQAYAKGKPDVIEWRTLMTAMPAQLKQVATAMGYINSEELGGALRDGSESMDAFIDTIVKLNQEGLPGLANFEQQARNATNGIQTALKNMKSRTVQGVTAMIDGIDKGLQEAKLGNIATILENIGNFFRDNLKKLAPYVTQLIVKLAEIGNWISEHRTLLEAIIVPLVTFIGTFSLIAKVIAIVKGISAALSVLNAVMLANPIGLIIAAVAALIAVFIYLWNHCEGFRNFFIGLWEGLKTVVSGVISWFKSIPNKITEIIDNVKTGISNFISNIVSFFQAIPGKIVEFLQKAKAFIEKIPYYIGYIIGFVAGKIWLFLTKDLPDFINGVINWFRELPGKIWEIITNLWNSFVIWFNDAKDKAIKGINDLIDNIVAWFKELPGKLKEIFTNVINTVKQWFIDMWNKVKVEVPKIVNNIVNWFQELPGKMLEIGKNIIHGMWDGIKNAKDWLWGKITGFASGIVQGFKDALGIKSPSKEFAIIGRYSVLGYNEGLEQMDSEVQKQLAETFALSPQLSPTNSMHFSPNIINNNYVDIKQDPLGQMVNNIKTFAGGAKNDYNYGAGL